MQNTRAPLQLRVSSSRLSKELEHHDQILTPPLHSLKNHHITITWNDSFYCPFFWDKASDFTELCSTKTMFSEILITILSGKK